MVSRCTVFGETPKTTGGTPVLPGRRRAIFPLLCAAFLLPAVLAAAPVELRFTAPASEREPLSRQLWADVLSPDGTHMRLPAFHVADDEFAVRTTARLRGDYTLTDVLEATTGGIRNVDTSAITRGVFHVASPDDLWAIGIDPRDSRSFADASGAAYVPIGTNLPWSPGPHIVEYFQQRFRQLEFAGLNWTRIWMCHWGGLNLDWLSGDDTVQPEPGTIDAEVAGRWDVIVSLAEKHGIRIQLVLQHHGQFSTQVNPNWSENPWNAASAHGFLNTPGEFFSSEKARQLTRQKYRYIVARWGYSNAILAWELFNEVHWVDAYRVDKKEGLVAAWHDEMARWLRSVDPHHRLVTTSTDDLHSPIYASMDFLQPHRYASGLISAVRHLEIPSDRSNLPVFFGEIGDDNIPLSPEEKRLSRGTMPPVWSGLMGDVLLPPQIWYGERLIAGGQLYELESVAKFLRETRLAERDLQPFSPAVESEDRIPLVVKPAMRWERQRPDPVDIPLDGSWPINLGSIPAFLVSEEESEQSGFPSEIRLHITYPEPCDARLVLAGAGPRGSEAVVFVDGREVARPAWPARDEDEPSEERTAGLRFEAGPHAITLRNPTGADWFEFSRFETGLEAPALATVGRRGEDFIALWVWNRQHIHTVDTDSGSTATILVEDVSAGEWKLSRWDSIRGKVDRVETLSHPGGLLELNTPPIARHAAFVLERE